MEIVKYLLTFLLTFAFSICTFTQSKLIANNIIPNFTGQSLECSQFRKGEIGCNQPGQHLRLYFLKDMESALRLTSSLEVNTKKDYTSEFNASQPKYGVLFTDFIRKTVIQKQRRLSKSYSDCYNTLITTINRFIKESDCSMLYTNSITEEFIDDFIIYLQDKGYRANYIYHNICLIKSMVKKAGLNNYAIDPSYMNVNYDKEDSFAVYLSTIEISHIYYSERLTRTEQKTKDLFIVGCLTGLRYSDYSTLNKDNIQGDFIVKVTKKTGTKVYIPIHEIVKDIIVKYDGFPKGTSIQNFNREIRKICMKVGIDTLVTYTYTEGTEIITKTVPKYELISSHTARRSAATNMILAGVQPYQAMAITGHATEKCFFRYLQITRESIARQIAGNNIWKK
jgi:integrase